MKLIVSIVVLLIITIQSIAQGEANIWYFGENAGLDFSSGSPVVLTDGQLSTFEGCSSYSDPYGNLLFYSDGTTVWNKNHEIMENGTGLKGDNSSSQSAIIIPKPSSSTLFYIFTVGSGTTASGTGINYYTVDMAVNGGLGKVTSGSIFLSGIWQESWSEKVAAVRGGDCDSYWVVSYDGGNLQSFKIDEFGINNNPVISPAPAPEYLPQGYLKISPDGKKLAIAHQVGIRNGVGDGSVILYDFDDITGKASNPIRLFNDSYEEFHPYGLEFSKKSTKLYTSTFDGTNMINKVFQYDLENTDIPGSQYLIHSQVGWRGALQLGPDGKIYAVVPPAYGEGNQFLNVIMNPDELGENVIYVKDAIHLGSGIAMQGLPPFISSIFLQIEILGDYGDGNSIVLNGKDIDLCEGDNITLSPDAISGSGSYDWTLNGTTIATSKDLVLSNISSTDIGYYNLEVVAIDDCGRLSYRTGNFTIRSVNELPSLNPLPYSLIQCDDDSDGFNLFDLTQINTEIVSNSTTEDFTYYQSENDAIAKRNSILNYLEYTNKIKDVDTVWVRVENENGCFKTTQIELIVVLSTMPSSFLNELSACDDGIDVEDGIATFDLSPVSSQIEALYPIPVSVFYYTNEIDAILKNNAITDPSNFENITSPFFQKIWVRVDSELGNDCLGLGHHINVTVLPIPKFEIESPQIICTNSSGITLESFMPEDTYSYEWSNEQGLVISQEPTVLVLSGGEYTVTATYTNPFGTNCQSQPKKITVLESSIPQIDISAISVVDNALDNSININTSNLGIGNYEFALDDEYGGIGFFQDEPFFSKISPGIRTIYVNDKNNCGSSQIQVPVIGFPKFFTPNNDGRNDTWQIQGVANGFYTASLIYIYDRFGKIIAKIDPASTGWDGIYNGQELPSTDYWYSVQLINNDGHPRNVKGHFSLIRR